MKKIFGIGLSTIDISYKEKENQLNRVHKELELLDIYLGGTIGTVLAVISSLGGNANYCGRIGNCLKGNLKRQLLMEQKINIIEGNKIYNEEDIVLIKIDNKGERFFSSATNHRGEVDLAMLYEKVNDGDYIILDGHYCKDVISFLEFLKEGKRDVTIVLSVAKPEPDLWPEDISYLFPYADIIVGGSGILEKLNVHKMILQKKKIIQTNGNKPIEYITREGKFNIAIEKMDNIKDTTGAGDFFLGAFIWMLSCGREYLESIKYAAGVASKSCCYYGNKYLEVINNNVQ